ncbi:GNAT family N-acetyltransferase [Psychroflexus sp. YR1-1]|uniref:GNAT family N-acetyltransferase n=1 Tax=Psychroflexus aurantiacus TaxID=2709310 RepID=A0A6B3R5H8_9FLAO|nr:GNAT family N-acetyltransferase [Psychroflexus aurantiacus]NEV93091.1 GNAT family N-acetyltransferase [Psychroflexus aurantiacus]
MTEITIRPIQEKDNKEVAEMIRHVLVEKGAPKVGTAYEDKALDQLFETYHKERSEYFVLLEGDRILGSAGISPLDNGDPKVCELQKMYFDPSARGRGLGMQMMKTCLDFARAQEFQVCYIETLPSMKAAQKLYQKTGFDYISDRMGDTGHYSCTIFMKKELN